MDTSSPSDPTHHPLVRYCGISCNSPAQLQGWIWAGLALHLLDRFARLLRISYYTILKRVSGDDDRPEGEVTVLTSDTIRVSVRTRQSESSDLCSRSGPETNPDTLMYQIGSPGNMCTSTVPSSRLGVILLPVRHRKRQTFSFVTSC